MKKTLVVAITLALAGCNGFDMSNRTPEERAALINALIGIQQQQRVMGVPQTYDPIGVGMIGRSNSPIYVCSYYGCP